METSVNSSNVAEYDSVKVLNASSLANEEEHEFKVCRGCLATDVRLINIFETGLAEDFGDLIKVMIHPSDALPPTICSFCVSLLRKATVFRKQCCAAHSSLLRILSSQQKLTKESLSTLDKLNFTINLTRTSINTTSSDFMSESSYSSIKKKKVKYLERNFTRNDINSESSKDKFGVTENYIENDLYQDKDLNDIENDDINSVTIKYEHDVSLDIDDDTSSEDKPLIKISTLKLSNKDSNSIHEDINFIAIKSDQDKKTVNIVDDSSIVSVDKKRLRKSNGNTKSKEKVAKSKESLQRNRQKSTLSVRKTKYNEKDKLEKDKRKGRKKIRREEKIEISRKNKLEQFSKENEVDIAILTKEQQIQEIQKRKNSNEYKNAKFKCEKCFKIFVREKSFKQHLVKYDKSRGDFECDVCGVRLKTRRNLKHHEVLNHLYTYTCRICKKTYKHQNSAVNHSKIHRNEKLTCKQCGKQFRHRSGLSEHNRKAHGSARCPVCDFVCFKAVSVQQHIAIAHNLPCDYCGARFQTIEALTRHRTEAVDNACDNGKKPCTVCGEGFNSERAFEDHKSSCKPPPKEAKDFECDKCHRRFTTNHSLIEHMSRFDGQICPLRVVTPGVKRNKTTNQAQSKQHNGRVFMCEVCGKDNFTCEATLRIHQRIHTGEKPFQCEICNKAFRLKMNLKGHMTVHTGEKRYECSVCGQRFKQSPHLKSHVIAMHTNEKPFECKYCGKRFPYLTSKREHEKAHQGIYRNRTPGHRKKHITMDPHMVGE